MQRARYRDRRQPTSRQLVGWLAALGCAYLVGYFLLPSDHVRGVAWSVSGFGAALLLLTGIELNHPPRRWPWWALAAGAASSSAADMARDLASWRGVDIPSPGYPDAVYLGAYIPLLAGVWGLLARGNRRQDHENSMDAIILAVGAAAVGYVLIGEPILAEDTMTPAATAVALAYPALDLVLVAFLGRLAFGGLRRNPAIWLACAGTLCWLVGDLAKLWLSEHNHSLGDAVDAPWLCGYWLLALAAAHPAMARIGTRATGTHRPPGGPRLVVLGIAGVVNPVLVIYLGVRGEHGSPLVVLGCSGIALFLVVSIRMGLLVGSSARHVVELGTALDAKRRLEESLRRMAHQDPLTDLANRAAFTEEVDRALRDSPRGLLVMIDLDGFKAVNDTFGHATGDQLLVAAGMRFGRTLRGGDMLARLGGDEFAVWLPEVLTKVRAAQTAERLTSCCHQPFSVRAGEAVVTASIGAAFARQGDDVDSLMARADHAMYEAKRSGKNAYVVAGDRPAVPAD
jgi:diguanylate cyclase (GGDEF)-like protein